MKIYLWVPRAVLAWLGARARFQAAPTSLLTTDAADDVRRRAVLWGTSNEFVVCTATCVRLVCFAAQALANLFVATSLSEHEERRRCDAV